MHLKFRSELFQLPRLMKNASQVRCAHASDRDRDGESPGGSPCSVWSRSFGPLHFWGTFPSGRCRTQRDSPTHFHSNPKRPHGKLQCQNCRGGEELNAYVNLARLTSGIIPPQVPRRGSLVVRRRVIPPSAAAPSAEGDAISVAAPLCRLTAHRIRNFIPFGPLGSWVTGIVSYASATMVVTETIHLSTFCKNNKV